MLQRVVKNWKAPMLFSGGTGSYRPNGYGRRCQTNQRLPFRADAFGEFGLTDLRPEPVFGDFIGEHYLDGACTHEHSDSAPAGFTHIRANWMLSKPVEGGDPILNGKVLQVETGDLWICFASEENHASTPIRGGIRRICSFGGIVPFEHADQLRKAIL